jgi:hypothetical protein
MSSTHLAPAPGGRRSGSGRVETHRLRDLDTRGLLGRNAADYIIFPRVAL